MWNPAAMAGDHEGHRRRHRGAGHAAAGYPPAQGPDRHADRRHRAVVAQLCGADGTRVHQAAAGGGHCGGKGARRVFRKAAVGQAGGV